MGDTERLIPERLGDQETQAAHLVHTGNGPTVEGEQQLLAEVYGAPDMAGFYSGPEVVVDQDDEPEAAADEPADEGTAPADDAAKGGKSA